ncbi:hypothetical protein Tco_0939417 [Tanacetum coccineum]|uniref:Uncharacterized protein n=1 Tax=Tanacetum coccineum TaxID=301880 RepID=A0ABQ5DKK4_9ASTR
MVAHEALVFITRVNELDLDPHLVVHGESLEIRDNHRWSIIGVLKTCNNDKNLSEIQLEHEKEDELVAVVVMVVHELDCMMVVKEIENGLLEEVEVSLFGKKNGGLSKTLMMKESRIKKMEVVVKYEN